MVLRISTAWLRTPLDVDSYPTAWYARKRWEWPSMTKSRFIVAGALRPAWTDGGLTRVRPGSGPRATPVLSLSTSGSEPYSTLVLVLSTPGSGPRSTPVLSLSTLGFVVDSGSGPQSTLHSPFVGFSHSARVFAVRLEARLPRLVSQ